MVSAAALRSGRGANPALRRPWSTGFRVGGLARCAALMAFKGFQLLAAMITVSELGALQHFDHSRQLIAYFGLVSSESTSGDKRRQGAITKTGNSHARWILIECATPHPAKL